jgi:DNA topoisomerase-1
MVNLVIVESAAKSKTIAKYLNNSDLVKKFGKFEVIASYGHIRDIVQKKPGTDCGINVDNWTAYYDNIKGKHNVIETIANKIKSSKTVWLAADLDREGEAIAWHIKDMYQIKNYRRITFNEITESALINAIMNPRAIHKNLVDSQQGRRMLDRLIGFKLTTLLWKNLRSSTMLTAGRVQSVLLAIICDVEKKATEFTTSCYYTIGCNFTIGKINLSDCKLYSRKGLLQVENEKYVVDILKQFMKTSFMLKDIKIVNRKEHPPPPFITSTLQQESYSKLGFSSKYTMKIAQELYESGKITYMRTDSTSLSKDAKLSIKNFIEQIINAKFIDRDQKTRTKNAQEAHEAIRPSKLYTESGIQKSAMSDDQKKLYRLILKRTLGSLMESAIFEELHVTITHSIDLESSFIGKTTVLIHPGFMLLDSRESQNNLKPTLDFLQKNNSKLKAINCLARSIWRTPPARLSEPKVIKLLEKEGIGRPSTYSTILQKLFDRNFIEKRNIEGVKQQYTYYELEFASKKIEKSVEKKPYFSETAVLSPTEVGIKVNAFLSKHFGNIINTQFTALMESDLDSIAKGQKKLENVMKSFYDPFMKEFAKHLVVSKESKVDARTEHVEFKIGDQIFTVRNAKFGPVIQEGSKYISLKQYLLDTKKTLAEIDKFDVGYLSSMPKEVAPGIFLKYGRYGFYIQDEKRGNSKRIYRNELPAMFSNDYSEIIAKLKKFKN